jgi:type IX secretion system PorP/SprF family membrane protein
MTYNYYIGFSVNQLLQIFYDISYEDYDVKADSVKVNRWPHFYLTGGFHKLIDHSKFDLEPSFLLKTSESINPQLDINLKLFYDNQYWFGLSYRTSSSVVALVGMKINRLYIGYAYDYSFNEVRHFSWGSHELSVSYKLGDSARRYRWLKRY